MNKNKEIDGGEKFFKGEPKWIRIINWNMYLAGNCAKKI